MALDTFDEIWNKVLLRVPAATPSLARDWVNEAFRRVIERREWSWLLKRSQFIVEAPYTTGTVTVTRNSNAVTGSGTTWTGSMIGRQFKSGLYTHTIETVPSTTSLTLDQNWGGSTASGQTYSIVDAYKTPPSDFHHYVSVADPSQSYQLWLGITQEWLNGVDPQRTHSGEVWAVANLDYTADSTGTPGLPRYEFWPHPGAERNYPFLYVRRPTDLSSSGTIPRYIPGGVLLMYAMAEACAWPGTSDRPNPAMAEWRSKYFMDQFNDEIARIERQDEEIFARDVVYSSFVRLPYAQPDFSAFPFLGDWYQTHDYPAI